MLGTTEIAVQLDERHRLEVMRGATGGVQRKVLGVYRDALYIHSAHQLNLIMQQATTHTHVPLTQFFPKFTS